MLGCVSHGVMPCDRVGLETIGVTDMDVTNYDYSLYSQHSAPPLTHTSLPPRSLTTFAEFSPANSNPMLCSRASLLASSTLIPELSRGERRRLNTHGCPAAVASSWDIGVRKKGEGEAWEEREVKERVVRRE